MSSAQFTLSAFGDEIAEDLTEQLRLLTSINVKHLEFRAAWGTNILHMSDDEVSKAKRICDAHGVAISCIGSPIGKSPITDPIETELDNLKRIIAIANMLDTKSVRIFSFYPPDTSNNAQYDDYIDEAATRLNSLAALAADAGFTLYLENEKDIVGDSIARCKALLDCVGGPGLEFAWDPANFVQVEAGAIATDGGITDRGWALLGPRTQYVHIKDVSISQGKVVAAGEGDGQVAELLVHLRDSGYQGMLALEPHLVNAGHSSGFSGPEWMRYAVEKLRELMAKLGCEEVT